MIRVLITKNGEKSKLEWWLNFIEYCFPHPRTPMGTHEHIEIANVELMNWSAQLWIKDKPDLLWRHAESLYLDFYDEHAYHWFVLRWS